MPASLTERSQIRILLVEDHRAVRESLRLMLESQQDLCVVGEVDEGAAAIEAARRLTPDIVLMDISMPGMNGLMATRAIHQLLPGIKVVILTRHNDRTYFEELQKAEVAGYVLKQSATTELLNAVRAVAAGQRYVDAALRPRTDGLGDVKSRTEAMASISGREEEVLRHTAWGQSNKEIADLLGLSVKTVEAHKANAMRKLRLSSRQEIVRLGVLKGWLDDPGL